MIIEKKYCDMKISEKWCERGHTLIKWWHIMYVYQSLVYLRLVRL